MVLDLFQPLRPLIIRISKSTTVNWVFQLHCQLTALVLLACSILITARQYFGDPINCYSSHEDYRDVDAADEYCWIHSTYTVDYAMNQTVGVDVIYPGIARVTAEHPKITQHKYYQWVCIMLAIQAIMFYMPYRIWRTYENGLVKELVWDLYQYRLENHKTDEPIDRTLEYLKVNWGYHNWYFFVHVFCELLNFINVIVQAYLIDVFFGGAFINFGTEVIRFIYLASHARVDPFIAVFPRLTKCSFYLFNDAGTLDLKDVLCLLPLNVFNEKIYVYLWFWLVILAVVSCGMLFYRLLLIFSGTLRKKVLYSNSGDAHHFNVVLDSAKIGDWFIIYLIDKNINPMFLNEIIEEFAEYLLSDLNKRQQQ